MERTPQKGLRGLVENWQSDLIAAISVALIALPLSLGIALAAGAPPMAGIISAVVGGVVTTLYRGGHIAVNGPAKGVIAVILGGIAIMDDGTGQAFYYVLAAVVCAGAIQVILGLLKLGRFADMIHSSVIHGLLAAIGLIIFAKQIHVALGTHSDKYNIVGNLVDAVILLPQANPFVVVISLVGLLLLIFHSRISYKLFHLLPTPMWVIALSIPFAYLFDFFQAHEIPFLGKNFEVGPELLLHIPDNILDSIAYPNFSKIDTIEFWTTVVSILLITSIESLAIAKAIDKIDPYKRKTDLNKDLTGIGLSTMVAGFLGGLPIIAVIIRSTVNVQNGAKTKWSNMYQGLILLLFIVVMSPILQQVPLCAFAILLVYTGFKLASPKVFKQVYSHGIEQLIFFVSTMILTLYTNLLIGLFGGLAIALLGHLLLTKVSPPRFFNLIFNGGSNMVLKPDGSYMLKLRGIVNFLSILRLNGFLEQIPAGSKVSIDLSETRLVGSTILELLYDFQKMHQNTEGTVEIRGLERHISSTNHKLATKIKIDAVEPFTKRQRMLKEMAESYGWNFQVEPVEDLEYFQSFYFFKTRPIEAEYNCISDQDQDMHLELLDVTFEEGAFMLPDEYDTTIGLLKLPFSIPKFTIEKKILLERVLPFSEHKDIDYTLYPHFPKNYIVKVEDIQSMDDFLTEKLKVLIEISGLHHFESNGEAILIFSNSFKLAQIQDYAKMIQFAENFKAILKEAEEMEANEGLGYQTEI
ncbi:MAG: SulP family inorganic anion transporter [Bacteroidota bacterium]